MRKGTFTPKQQEELSAEAKYYLVVQAAQLHEAARPAPGRVQQGVDRANQAEELQRVNKEIKEDNLEEEEKRRETSSKFQLIAHSIAQSITTACRNVNGKYQFFVSSCVYLQSPTKKAVLDSWKR